MLSPNSQTQLNKLGYNKHLLATRRFTCYVYPAHTPLWASLAVRQVSVTKRTFWTPKTEYRRPNTEHRIPKTEYRRPNTLYRTTNTEHHRPGWVKTNWLVLICALDSRRIQQSQNESKYLKAQDYFKYSFNPVS